MTCLKVPRDELYSRAGSFVCGTCTNKACEVPVADIDCSDIESLEECRKEDFKLDEDFVAVSPLTPNPNWSLESSLNKNHLSSYHTVCTG